MSHCHEYAHTVCRVLAGAVRGPLVVRDTSGSLQNLFYRDFSYHAHVATTCTMVSEPYIVRNVVSLCNLCVKRVMHLLAALLAKARCTITGETLIDRAHKVQTC